MEPMNFNSVFFVKLHIYNYGPFLGPNDFVFDRHRTLIIGEGGAGKTIIVNCFFRSLGPATGIEPHIRADQTEMSVEVVTSGNRQLVKRYRNLIFLGCRTEASFGESGS